MTDLAQSFHLMVGLLGAAYLLLATLGLKGAKPSRQALPVAIAVAVVVGLWVFAPGLLRAGAYALTVAVRRAGLILSGIGIVVLYLSVRPMRAERAFRVPRRLATPLWGIGLAVATANWIVAVAVAVLVIRSVLRPPGASPAEDPPQPQDPPGNE